MVIANNIDFKQTSSDFKVIKVCIKQATNFSPSYSKSTSSANSLDLNKNQKLFYKRHFYSLKLNF